MICLPTAFCSTVSWSFTHELSTGAIHFHETSKTDIAEVCCELYQQSPDNSRVMAPTKALVSEINKLTQQAVNPDSAGLS